ncbi:unnamed protein product [Protopolystoma xenopodis]|uniref:Uncharacterized protein n=1 Tax=Protopolystoma xenopodis TaxID=117903 RepID=A0A448WN90_9PLAT|nr:unnamed protein product [Protopolystoma xenopodis]
MFENVPSPLSDAGNHDNCNGRRLRTRTTFCLPRHIASAYRLPFLCPTFIGAPRHNNLQGRREHESADRSPPLVFRSDQNPSSARLGPKSDNRLSAFWLRAGKDVDKCTNLNGQGKMRATEAFQSSETCSSAQINCICSLVDLKNDLPEAAINDDVFIVNKHIGTPVVDEKDVHSQHIRRGLRFAWSLACILAKSTILSQSRKHQQRQHCMVIPSSESRTAIFHWLARVAAERVLASESSASTDSTVGLPCSRTFVNVAKDYLLMAKELGRETTECVIYLVC